MSGGARDWLRLGLALLGLAIAAYLTLQHYDSHVPLACVSSGIVDCAAVLTSPASVALGVPLAVWGLVWFVVMTGLAGASLRGGALLAQQLQRYRVWWTAAGAVAVVYFVYAELIRVGKLCLWCTSVHVIVLLLLTLEVTAPQAAPEA